MADDCKDIPLRLLRPPWIVMRPVVKDSIEYLERRDSVKRFGLTNSLCVRPSAREPASYEVIDGNWRYEVAQELDLESVPCIIKTGLTDTDVLAIQIQANAVRADTTPVEYSRQLRRILDQAGGKMTISELARIAGKHPTWVKDRLGLLNLDKDMQLIVDRGEVPVQSAYMLAKIPSRWRRDYLEQARAMPSKKFCALAAGVIKQFTECVQQGRMDERYMPDFKPQHYLRGLKEFKAELDNPQVGASLLVAEGCTTILDAWNACLRWAMHLDRRSVEEQRHSATRKAQSRFKKETEAAHEPLD